jgi:hypothetical protein
VRRVDASASLINTQRSGVKISSRDSESSSKSRDENFYDAGIIFGTVCASDALGNYDPPNEPKPGVLDPLSQTRRRGVFKEFTMRKQIVRVVTGVFILALASAAAMANGKSEQINFQQGFQLNGTQIEKGTYKVTYDAKSGELSVADKNGKVVAHAKARTEQSEKKNTYTTFTTGAQNGAQSLRSVSFAGERQKIVIGEGGASSTATSPAQ